MESGNESADESAIANTLLVYLFYYYQDISSSV
jgi:hypothetical protein